MITMKSLQQLNADHYEQLGYTWHDETSDSIEVTEMEINSFIQAGEELYNMFIDAGDYILANNLFYKLEIPEILIPAIQYTWENNEHRHLYGRFDLIGGIDGIKPKLIEFNADTPTSLFETSVVQWLQLKYNGLNVEKQFNFVYESLTDSFKELKKIAPPDLCQCLFTSYSGSDEDILTTQFIEETAINAGFMTRYAPIEDLFFDNNGIYFKEDDKNFLVFRYLFKLIPWEQIALVEPDLCKILVDLILNNKAVILNPPYSLLFQSKAIM